MSDDPGSKKRTSAVLGSSGAKENKENVEGTEPWRKELDTNSVVRVWDGVFGKWYPAVVTKTDSSKVSLRFCPKYPDGSYCGCTVDYSVSKTDGKLTPYVVEEGKVATSKAKKLAPAPRSESLDHLSCMMWGKDSTSGNGDSLMLTRGPGGLSAAPTRASQAPPSRPMRSGGGSQALATCHEDF